MIQSCFKDPITSFTVRCKKQNIREIINYIDKRLEIDKIDESSNYYLLQKTRGLLEQINALIDRAEELFKIVVKLKDATRKENPDEMRVLAEELRIRCTKGVENASVNLERLSSLLQSLNFEFRLMPRSIHLIRFREAIIDVLSSICATNEKITKEVKHFNMIVEELLLKATRNNKDTVIALAADASIAVTQCTKTIEIILSAGACILDIFMYAHFS